MEVDLRMDQVQIGFEGPGCTADTRKKLLEADTTARIQEGLALTLGGRDPEAHRIFTSEMPKDPVPSNLPTDSMRTGEPAPSTSMLGRAWSWLSGR